MSRRDRYLFVCVNRRPDGTPKGSCAAKGAVELHARLKQALEARGLGARALRACTSSCLDLCHAGPTVGVFPDGYFYGRLRLEDVDELVDAFAEGRRVERLVLTPEDLERPS